MNQQNYYAKRVKVITSIYMIQGNVNDIIKTIADLNKSYEGQPQAEKELHDYIVNSKIMRFKPYLDKILTDIREIHPEHSKPVKELFS